MKYAYFAAAVAVVLATGTAPAADAPRPKNVILLIGDGMGFAAVDAASLYTFGHSKGQPYWNFQVLSCTTFSASGNGYDPAKAAKSFAYSLKEPTDSAAAATTLSSGVKTLNKRIGLDVDEKPIRHLYEDAEAMGKATGVLTTVYISHATPAAFTAHVESRNDIDVIAQDMIQNSTLDVLVGAGHPWYDDDGKQVGGMGDDPYKTKGDYKRLGGEKLWREIEAGTVGNDADGDGQADPWKLVDTLDGFRALSGPNPPKRVLGIVPVATTLQVNRSGDAKAGPFVVPLTPKMPDMALLMEGALNVLSQDPDGFFLMGEGGAIDWAAHGNTIGRLIEEQIDFDHAIEATINWVNAHSNWDDTLLIVTADHETGYLTGPGDKEEWSPLENRGVGHVPGYAWHTGGHTNQPVPCFARGAGAEKLLDAVKGQDAHYGPFIDNTDIPKVIRTVWR